ncbi:MAG: hypothetical protein ACOC3I_03570 [Verrucomicrobiota bacterium]
MKAPILLSLLSLLLLGVVMAPAQSVDLSERTTIRSDVLEMQGTEDRNHFYFRGHVLVEGTDLLIRANELTVTALRDPGEVTGTIGEIGAIEAIVAEGAVQIVQAGRTARAGRVEVDPVAGTVRFLEDPVIIQGDAEARAYGFVFHTRDKRIEAINPPGFAPGEKPGRATISLRGAASQLSVNVPEQDVLLGRPTGEEAGEDAGEAAEEDAPEPPATDETAPDEGEEGT